MKVNIVCSFEVSGSTSFPGGNLVDGLPPVFSFNIIEINVLYYSTILKRIIN